MRGTSEAAVALVAVVGVPVLVGQVAKPAAESPKRTETALRGPTETALSVRLQESEKDGSDNARLRVITDGQPPTASAVLVTDDGRHPVKVTRAPRASCSSLPERRATNAPEATEWCLSLAGIDDGRKVAGTVKSSATALALTVNRREPILPWPLLAALGGMMLGAAVALVPSWHRSGVRTGLLDQTLARNDSASAERKVDGLSEWVARRREAGIPDDALLPVVTGVVTRGPRAARRARTELAAALAATALPGIHVFVVAATAEARKPAHSVGDFLEEDGSVRDIHPTREWLATLRQLEQQDGELAAAQQQIESGLKQECSGEPTALLDAARAAFTSVDAPAKTNEVDEKIEAVRQAIVFARSRRECRAEEEFFALAPVRGAGPAPEGREILDLGTAGVPEPPPLGLLRVATGVFMLTVVAWALLAIEQGVYEPKQAFGTTSDYVALITAAFGSGAAGAVLGLLAVWDRSASTTSE